ncbi:YcbK family protein [Consotaella aegiceratis]|uniref:YcbK family protein n=1 Tax=Consotaella aegiceratis TaxID=3097961 RepID=UPI002F429164
MTSDTSRARCSALSSVTAVIAVVAILPLVASCVSSADDTATFGFASPDGGDLATGIAGVSSETAETTSEDISGAEIADTATATDGVETQAQTEMTAVEPASASLQKTAEAEQKPAAEARDAVTAELAEASTTSVGTRANSPALAAFAASGNRQPKPIQVAATTPSQSDKTFFESLFAESEAKAPIRNTDKSKSRRVIVKREGAPVPADSAALPGVDPKSLFEIGQRASADDEDMLEDMQQSYEVASLSGLARLSPSGLLVQREDVETGCFPPKLVSMIRAVERRFGKQAVVTSGYRSPAHNRAVNGATHSMHMACKAADIQVPGVSNKDIAQFVRAMPDRGGVGTYCHTTAVHIDIGHKRDWNWGCSRRRG